VGRGTRVQQAPLGLPARVRRALRAVRAPVAARGRQARQGEPARGRQGLRGRAAAQALCPERLGPPAQAGREPPGPLAQEASAHQERPALQAQGLLGLPGLLERLGLWVRPPYRVCRGQAVQVPQARRRGLPAAQLQGRSEPAYQVLRQPGLRPVLAAGPVGPA